MKEVMHFLISVSILAAGCDGPTTFTETSLIIPENRTIHVEEVDLSITNKGCSVAWFNAIGKGCYEKRYCNLILKRGDKTIEAGSDFEPVYLGNLEIKLEKINPWEVKEDSIPPGSCLLRIKLLEGR